MLTIEGLAMAGLGPPGAAPAQGGTPHVGFAAYLAAASDVPVALMPGGITAPSAASAVLDGLPLPALPALPTLPVEAEPSSGGTFTLLDLLTLEHPAPAAGDSNPGGSPRPDRSSEATESEDNSPTAELLAAAFAGRLGQTLPQPVPPQISMPVALAPATLAAPPADGGTLASEGGTALRVAAGGDSPTRASDTATSRVTLPQTLPSTAASVPAPALPEEAVALTSVVGGQLESSVAPSAARGAMAGLEPVVSEDVPASTPSSAVHDVPREGSSSVSPPPSSGGRDGVLASEFGQAPNARQGQDSAFSSSLTAVDSGGAEPTASVPPAGSAPEDAVDLARTDLGLSQADRLEVGSLPVSQAGDSPRAAAETTESTEATDTSQATSSAASADSTQVDESAAVRISGRTIDAAATVAAPPPTVDATDRAALQARLADSVLTAARTDSSVRLVLNPPDLGHVEIRVERGELGLRVELVTATADAADLIKQQLPSLVSGLEARAVRVDQADVRQAPPSGSSGLNLGSDARQAGGEASGSGGQWERPDWSEAARHEQESTRPQSGAPRSGLLDLVA